MEASAHRSEGRCRDDRLDSGRRGAEYRCSTEKLRLDRKARAPSYAILCHRTPRESAARARPSGRVATEVATMWFPQRYIQQGQRQGVPEATLSAATQVLDHFYSRYPDTPALLSLSHLAHRAQVPYWRLRAAVERAPYTYRHFTIRKRSGGGRRISVPHPDVMAAQRWITAHVLNQQAVHPASFAFRPGTSIVQCAARHTGSRWLIKLDITGFFEAISEIAVFRIFRSLGYEPLLSFELARLTTWTASSPFRYQYQEWKNYCRHTKIEPYKSRRIGNLPQGAPTSPMLSNLVMREMDEEIALMSRQTGLTYTRYSDDMTFSTRHCFDRRRATSFVGEGTLRKCLQH